MALSPEERRQIYEEEKARIEAEEKLKKAKQTAESSASTGLEPNVAGVLCYVGLWVSGIIFFILEQKSKFVRFHAVQSIIVFGILTVAGIILGSIPIIGITLSSLISVVIFILWIILMIKASQGQLYKVPWAGNLAERILATTVDKIKEEFEPAKPPSPPETPPTPAAEAGEKISEKVVDEFQGKRSERIISSSFAIAWSIVLLIFFLFFNEYIAYYHAETVGEITVWNRYPFITEEFNLWLPILTATLTLSIIGHSILIALDRYLLREVTLIVLDVFGIATVLTLLSIFPFNFSGIPNAEIASLSPMIAMIVLISITVGIGIGIIVRLVKLIVNIVRQGASQG